ncbi:MAG: aminotransferase class I/II-fold pyridoxal phosphate-dependent enzyme, partial [Pirellulales bacterium]
MKSQTAPFVALSRRVTQGGRQPISELMHRGLAQPEIVSLAAGFVDQASLPVDAFRQAAEALFADPHRARAALQYGTTPGLPRLRKQVLDRLLAADRRADAEDLSIDRVVITGGSNQLLHLVTSCLCDEGDIVLVAAPTYFVYLGLLGSLGVRAVGVEADEDGLVADSLEAVLQQLQRSGELPRVKMIYIVTYFDNPSSITLSAIRRAQIVELAQRFSLGGTAGHRIHILEDAAYRDLRYAGEDIPSLWSHDDGQHGDGQ